MLPARVSTSVMARAAAMAERVEGDDLSGFTMVIGE